LEDKDFLELSYGELLKGVESGPHPVFRTEKCKAAINIKCTQDYVAAINKASEVSDKHSKSLTRATWVLALVTVGLFLATVAMTYVNYLNLSK